MDSIKAIDEKISYLKNLITDWNLENETKVIYETKIAALEAERAQLTQIID